MCSCTAPRNPEECSMRSQTFEYPFDYYYVSGIVTAQALTYNIALVEILI